MRISIFVCKNSRRWRSAVQAKCHGRRTRRLTRDTYTTTSCIYQTSSDDSLAVTYYGEVIRTGLIVVMLC